MPESNDLVDQLLLLEAKFDELLPLLHNKANYTEMLPVGAITYFANNDLGKPVIPKGFLFCDGKVYSRTIYHELFEAIGTTYGEGDGSTTFNVPDLRKLFIRGWDDRQEDRPLGSVQQDAMQKITGSFGALDSVRTEGAFAPYDKSSHTYARTSTVSLSGVDFDSSRVVRTADETRPVNVVFIPCIKYTNFVGINATFYSDSDDLYVRGSVYVRGEVKVNEPWDFSYPDSGIILASTINVLHKIVDDYDYDIPNVDIQGTLNCIIDGQQATVSFGDPAIVVNDASEFKIVLAQDIECDSLILIYNYQWMPMTKEQQGVWVITDENFVQDFTDNLNKGDVQLQLRTMYKNYEN